MNKQFETEIKVGLFVSIGLGLVLLAILVLGSSESFLSSQVRYKTFFPSVDGLIVGSKVVVGGFQVGSVAKVDLDQERRQIRIEIGVQKKFKDWIRSDTQAELMTQGVLGDKYIGITAGNPEQPELAPGSEIPNKPSKDLSQFLSKGDQLMVSLNNIASSLDHLLKNFEAGGKSETFFQGMATTAKNLSVASDRLSKGLEDNNVHSALANLNGVLGKINNGTGTLGAIVNDPGLYDDIKALFGGVNRSRIMRNLVRQTVKKSEEAEFEAGQLQEKQAPAPKPNK